jgi:hypothetical protein
VKHPSQEDLLGYVLGALDAQEQRDVQQLIDADPELEEKLLEIRSSLGPLDYLDGANGPRPGLARRTSELVASLQKQLGPDEPATAAAHPITDGLIAEATLQKLALLDGEANENGTLAVSLRQPMFSDTSRFERAIRPSSWSLSDMLVGVAAVAVLASILLPAISYSRFNSRVTSCQNNLRSLGSALLTFSSMNPKGEFPGIPDCPNLAASGSYAPQLKAAGLIDDDNIVLCAGLDNRFDRAFRIPTCEQLKQATGCHLDHLKRIQGGNYGYSLGYMECNQYHCPSSLGRFQFVLLADMPSQDVSNGRRSANHGGRGQNCLFGDGHFEFVTGFAYGEDPIFVNDLGIVDAGTDSGDSVIAPSHIAPRIYYTSLR